MITAVHIPVPAMYVPGTRYDVKVVAISHSTDVRNTPNLIHLREDCNTSSAPGVTPALQERSIDARTLGRTLCVVCYGAVQPLGTHSS